MKFPRVKFELKEEDRLIIRQYAARKGINCDKLAQKIGISYMQLYKPYNGCRNCSRESYLKIQKFLKKIERQDG